MIGIRAARKAGNTPPATPIRTASAIPATSEVPLMRKAKATSAKFAPPAAEVMPLAGSAIRQPSAPPTMARNVDSMTNAARMLRLRESERAQRADFAGPRRDECVHRVHRAEHRADAHDDRHEDRQPEELPCDDAGLILVVLALLYRLHLHARVVLQLGVERADRRRVAHAQRDRVIAAAVERGADDVHVAPDLALETAAVGVEDADDLPVAALQLERPPDLHALDALEDLPADDDFVQAGLKVPAVGDRNRRSAR